MDDVNGKEGGFLVSKIDFFDHISPHLADKVTVCIILDGPVEIGDNLFMLECAMNVMPLSIAIHPEYGVFF